MYIKHTNYSEGVHEINLIENVSQLHLEEPFFGNVEFSCKLDKSHHQIVLDCDVRASAHLVCDRCGEEFEADLGNDFELLFIFGRNADGIENDDVFYLAPDEDKLELTQSVHDYVMLSIPFKNLCKSDCKGLCPSCGTNLNESSCNCDNQSANPIWDKLKILKK